MMTSKDRVVMGHCPDCGSGRKAYVRGEHKVHFPDSGDGTFASETGMILECCGCERVYFRKDIWFSEWEAIGVEPMTGEVVSEAGIETKYWPAATVRERPKWLRKIEEADRDLGGLLEEMYSALDSGLRVLAAIAARTVFDRAAELLGINPANNFKEKLSSLGAYGKISIDEESTLEVLVDAGSAAAHRGWRPTPEELSIMIDVVESFLHRSFAMGDGIAKLKTSIPAKLKRTKSQGHRRTSRNNFGTP
jgi:uncharacterized protein DUF4145